MKQQKAQEQRWNEAVLPYGCTDGRRRSLRHDSAGKRLPAIQQNISTNTFTLFAFVQTTDFCRFVLLSIWLCVTIYTAKSPRNFRCIVSNSERMIENETEKNAGSCLCHGADGNQHTVLGAEGACASGFR
jgi:hypothetical protein